MAKDRKAGYYWIQKDDKWMIAEWIYGFWYIAGSELEYSNTEIYEVGDYIGRGGDKVYLENANCAIFDVIASVCDELLVKASEYETIANNDYDTEGVQHNLNIGRYDGLMQAIAELNKHLL